MKKLLFLVMAIFLFASTACANGSKVTTSSNSWNFTRLGKVITADSTITITQAELKKILGKGDVTAVFSVME